MIPINLPQIGEEEIEAVVNVMRKGPLTNALGAGPIVKQFEEGFSQFAGSKYSIAMNTGTAALHAAVLAMGMESGVEVILPSFTFVATAEAVVLAGAKPVFVDIDPVTYNIAPSEIEGAITSKTKIILPVDLYGLSADMKPINEIANTHGLKVIEDAAQAHGASYLDKPPGAFAQAACWSLYASKNMTTGEGGVITTNDAGFKEKLRMVRTHGEKAKYSSQMLGNNYRMSEIQAAIGVVQLKKLHDFVDKRRTNAHRLNKILADSDQLQLPTEPKDGTHSWYLYTIRLLNGTESNRDRLLNFLRSRGIGAEAYYLHPVHTMPFYRDNFGTFSLPETMKASEQVFSLPVHPGVTSDQIDFIGETMLQALSAL